MLWAMASYMRPDPANGVIEVGSVAHGPAMKRSRYRRKRITSWHGMCSRILVSSL